MILKRFFKKNNIVSWEGLDNFKIEEKVQYKKEKVCFFFKFHERQFNTPSDFILVYRGKIWSGLDSFTCMSDKSLPKSLSSIDC